MGHNRDAGADYGDYLTYAQSAQVLKIHVSNVAKLVSNGHLSSRGRRKAALSRTEVEALAQNREQRAERLERQAAERLRDPRPDDERDWIGTADVAQLIGITPQAVVKRLRRGRMPGVFHRGAWWVQREHALIAANVKATTGPDDVAEKAARAVLASDAAHRQP